MRLEKHISALLFENDCVIVPQFGAFLARYQSATLEAENHIFYPPKKGIGFNKLLVESDGLLEHYLSKKMDTTNEKTLLFLRSEVQYWQSELARQGFLSLEGLGDFKVDKQGKWNFTPEKNINFLPAAYGLLPVVSAPVNVPAVSKEIKSLIPAAEPQHRPIPAYFKYAAVAVIALGVSGFLGFDYYTGKIEKENQLARQKAEKLLEKKIQQATFEPASNTQPLTINLQSTKYPYHVIAGAFRVEENAQKRVSELLKNGYRARLLGQNKYGLHQVAFQSFDNRSAALQFLADIRKNQFPQAWMLIEEL